MSDPRELFVTCGTCGRETCTDATAERLKRALAVLRRVEWSRTGFASFGPSCPACCAPIEKGHADGCRLAAVLSEGEP
jgi:hypothetical protein